MDQQNRYLQASVVRWTHDGKSYSEELTNKRSRGNQLSLADRILFASGVFNDVMAGEDTVTRIWFGGRMHTITEQQLHDLWIAAQGAEIARGEVLEEA